VFRREAPRLRRCPMCRAEAVSASRMDIHEDGIHARVVLACGQCETTRELDVSVWAADAYERRLDKQRSEMEEALRRTERERLEGETRTFATALHRDLIGPDDFGVPGRSRSEC
jgi:transcription elongation factor Elf1